MCCEEVEPGEELTVLMCAHAFHAQCLQQWLKIRASCPVCRHEVTCVSSWQRAGIWRFGLANHDATPMSPSSIQRRGSVHVRVGGEGEGEESLGAETSTVIIEMTPMDYSREEHQGEGGRGGEGGGVSGDGDVEASRTMDQSRFSEVTLTIRDVDTESEPT